MANHSDVLRNASWGLGAGLIALAWAATPIVRFMAAPHLLLIGVLAFGAAFFLAEVEDWEPVTLSFHDTLFAALGIVCVTGALVLAAYNGIGAVRDAEANDRRCLAIQRDMLSAYRRMKDGPDVFQALGCRPQGRGLIRVPTTDREVKAGHPLPDGGYPNR